MPLTWLDAIMAMMAMAPDLVPAAGVKLEPDYLQVEVTVNAKLKRTIPHGCHRPQTHACNPQSIAAT